MVAHLFPESCLRGCVRRAEPLPRREQAHFVARGNPSSRLPAIPTRLPGRVPPLPNPPCPGRCSFPYLSLQVTEEPSLGNGPVPSDGGFGGFENGRDFFGLKPCEETHFHHLAFP